MHRSNAALYTFALERLHPEAGEALLEIGFGSGRHFPQLLGMASGLRLSGLDCSADMVRAAREGGGAAELVLGSSEQMPFGDGTFDAVFCVNVVYFWEKPETHLREVWRVLRPGGRFLTAIRTPESLRAMPFTKHGFRLYNAPEWSAQLSAAGFTDICTARQQEPALVLDGRQVVLESLCVVGLKP